VTAGERGRGRRNGRGAPASAITAARDGPRRIAAAFRSSGDLAPAALAGWVRTPAAQWPEAARLFVRPVEDEKADDRMVKEAHGGAVVAAGERPHRTAKDRSPGVRFRRMVELVAPRPRARRHPAPRIEPVRRSWLAALWQARSSVRAGVPLDDFLRSRLARYLAALPVPQGRLPVTVSVDDGQLLVRPADPPAAAEAPPPDRVDPWLEPLVAVEGPAVRQEVAELEIRLSALDGERTAARRRSEELSRRLAADVAAGIVAAPSAVEATAEQLGRPPVRSAAAYETLVAFIAATLLATAWQVALPLLRAAGIDPTALRAALDGRPAEVAFVAVFALGVAAGLFALADASLGAAIRLFRGDDDVRRRRFLAAGAGAAAVLPVLLGAALAALPPGPGATPRWAFVLLLLALPLGAALLARIARADAERRAADGAAVLAWDRERARALADRARRLEELDWAAAEARELEAEREAAHRRLLVLNARAVEEGRLAAEAAEHERTDLSRLAQSLVAALELDRHEFIRQASARGAADLFAPRRRKAPPDARPVFDPAAPVETGRLAS
jgi:hypothetical protein